MGRPTGVTVIAILYFFGTAFCLVAGIGVIAGGGFFAEYVNKSGAQNAGVGAGILAAIVGVLGVILLVAAVLDIVVGVGLMKIKSWARVIAIALSGLAVLGAARGIVTSMLHFNLFSLCINLMVLALNGWIVWYLLQPNITAAFQGGQAVATTA
jgi:hypothetical protein